MRCGGLRLSCPISIRMRNTLARWCLSYPAAMFYCLTAYGLHETLEAPAGVSTIIALLAHALFLSSLGMWVVADARHRQVNIPYDFDSLVFFTWWFAAPLYLFYTRGWRAFAVLGLFILLYLGAALLCNIPSMLRSMDR